MPTLWKSPTGDGTAVWTTPDYTRIDDGAVPPATTPDDGLSAVAQDKGDSETWQWWTFGTVSASAATVITARVWCTVGAFEPTDADLTLGSTTLGAASLVSDGSWRKAEWTGLGIGISGGPALSAGLKAATLSNGDDCNVGQLIVERGYSQGGGPPHFPNVRTTFLRRRRHAENLVPTRWWY